MPLTPILELRRHIVRRAVPSFSLEGTSLERSVASPLLPFFFPRRFLVPLSFPPDGEEGGKRGERGASHRPVELIFNSFRFDSESDYTKVGFGGGGGGGGGGVLFAVRICVGTWNVGYRAGGAGVKADGFLLGQRSFFSFFFSSLPPPLSNRFCWLAGWLADLACWKSRVWRSVVFLFGQRKSRVRSWLLFWAA